MCLQVPRELRDQLAAELRGSDIPVPESEERWELAMQALRGVWASKYNDRCAMAL
jgi:alpha-glucan,water dikinase